MLLCWVDIMSATKGENLSSILEKTLDIIGSTVESDAGKPSNEISAASALLNERKKLKRSIDFDDFTPFVPAKKPAVVDCLVDSAAKSTVETPKYWNSGAAPMSKKQLNKKGYNKNLKKQKQKGEEYQDRHAGKVAAKLNKKSYFNKLKNSD